MAVRHGYGKIAGTDALVFAYDTGDTRNSYKGEPTTNVLNNNILGQGSGAFLSSDSIGAYIQLADLTSGYSRFQLPSIPVSSNDTYTWSFELMSPETITTNFYFDTNEYSDQFPASNDLSRASATARVPSTMPAGVWQQFSLTVTMKPDLTGAYTYDFFNMLYPTFQNKKVYYRNMQFEFKNHPTQYAGQGVTRSATQGLLDLTGNSTIDLANVSFDSNAQIVFDGTDDVITVPMDNLRPPSAITQEVVVYIDNNTTQVWIGSQYGTSSGNSYALWLNGANTLAAGVNIGGTFNNQSQSYPITLNTYYHFVHTYDGTTQRIYVNGVEVRQWATSGNITYNTNNTFLAIGNDWNGSGYNTGASLATHGKQDITKIYNRALTAAEVRNNYNQYKGRFNL